MPHVVEPPLGDPDESATDKLFAGRIVQDVDTSIPQDLAWVLDPFAPVPEDMAQSAEEQSTSDTATEQEQQ